MIFADDTPLIPDEHFEVDRHRSLEILQDVISSMRIVGFRTRLFSGPRKRRGNSSKTTNIWTLTQLNMLAALNWNSTMRYRRRPWKRSVLTAIW